MKIIMLGEKSKGKIKKMKQLTLKKFMKFFNQWKFYIENIEENCKIKKPFFCSKEKWDKYYECAYYLGQKDMYNEITMTIEKTIKEEIDNDNENTSKR